MKLALELHHAGDLVVVAAVAFDEWDAAEPTKTYTSRCQRAGKATAGEPDLRDLACMLQLLREHGLAPDNLLINGFVHLDAQETAGLGWHLYLALGGRVAVIGVARSARSALGAQYEVFREELARPLTVTCAGVDLGAAKTRLRAMHGRRRVPTLLKLATRIAKAEAS